MPTADWLKSYDNLVCKTDLDAQFKEKEIGGTAVDVLDIGSVHFPTGTIFACDLLITLEETPLFIQTIPPGTYPVKICVVPSKKYGDRYACAKVAVSTEKPVRYELSLTGYEDLSGEVSEGEFFGFDVDTGKGCIADIQTQVAFKDYWVKHPEEDPDIDPYNDLFFDLLEENAKAHLQDQDEYDDWLNWTIPTAICPSSLPAGATVAIRSFGYDAKGDICAVYVRLIDIEERYSKQA